MTTPPACPTNSLSICIHPFIPCLRNEALRHSETRPAPYLDRHSVAADDRNITVSWLMEVVAACGLQQATLFLAVSYLDRFLAESKVSPMTPFMRERRPR